MTIKAILFVKVFLFFLYIKFYALSKSVFYLFKNKKLINISYHQSTNSQQESSFRRKFLSKTIRSRIYLFKWSIFKKIFESMSMTSDVDFLENFDNQIRRIFPDFASVKNKIRFSHNGHLGDIIYSLLFLKNIASNTKKKIEYFIIVAENDQHLSGHPSGGKVMINKKAYLFIKPLIELQTYIKFLKYDENEEDSVDLSNIRNSSINLSAGLITDWYPKFFQYSIDLSEKWLNTSIKKDKKYKDALIISRSERYLNISIDYSFIKQLKNVFFLGSKKEFNLFKADFNLKNIRYLHVKDALEAAKIIYSSKVFLGNQSLFFSIAEGLKVTRALEVFEPAPNVIPLGKNSCAFLNNVHMIEFLEDKLNVNVDEIFKIRRGLPVFLHVR